MFKKIRANIYKRKYSAKDIRWVVRWKDPKTNKWKAFVAGNSKQEAQFQLDKVKGDLLMGKDPAPSESSAPQLSVAKLMQKFYESAKFQTAAPEYKSIATARLTKFSNVLGHKLLSELSRKMLLDFFAALKKEGLSNCTIHKYFCQISVVFAQHEFEDLNFKNPLKIISDFRKIFPKEPSTRDINFLTPEELDLLLEQIKTNRRSENLYALVKFLANTGLRRAEALDLMWTDIDRASGFIQVRNSKNRRARNIPIEQNAWDAISPLLGRGEHVFSSKQGQQFFVGSFLNALKRAAKKANINKRVDLHTLRHSFGSNKIRQGWGLKKVSLILGHSDITTTSKIYTHLLDGDLRVRDDFYFDIEDKNANSKISTDSVEAIKLLMKQIENLVVSTPSEKIFSDNGLRDSFVTKMKLQDSLVAIRNDSQKSVKTPLHATPVLRKQKKPLSASLSGNSGGLCFLNDFNSLDRKKLVGVLGFEPRNGGIKIR